MYNKRFKKNQYLCIIHSSYFILHTSSSSSSSFCFNYVQNNLVSTQKKKKKRHHAAGYAPHSLITTLGIRVSAFHNLASQCFKTITTGTTLKNTQTIKFYPPLCLNVSPVDGIGFSSLNTHNNTSSSGNKVKKTPLHMYAAQATIVATSASIQ